MSSLLQPRRLMIDALRQPLDEFLSTSLAGREQHGRDGSYNVSARPEVKAFARSTEEVTAIVETCAPPDARHRLRTGALLEGYVQALDGEVCIDLVGMNVEHR